MPVPVDVSAFDELRGFIEEIAETDTVPYDQKLRNLDALTTEVAGEKRLTDEERESLKVELHEAWVAVGEANYGGTP